MPAAAEIDESVLERARANPDFAKRNPQLAPPETPAAPEPDAPTSQPGTGPRASSRTQRQPRDPGPARRAALRRNVRTGYGYARTANRTITGTSRVNLDLGQLAVAAIGIGLFMWFALHPDVVRAIVNFVVGTIGDVIKLAGV